VNNEVKEIPLPNCMKNNLSIKAIDLQALNGIIKIFNEQNDKNDFQILLHTTYGFIKCDICDIAKEDNAITIVENPNTINEENSKMFTVDFSYLAKIRNDTLLEYEKENPEIKPCDNGHILSLKNVSLYKDNLDSPVFSINQMVVFLDQIIGFSPIPRIKS